MTDKFPNARDCAILCNEAPFQLYLRLRSGSAPAGEQWKFVRTKEDAAIAVRYLLEVDSRRELDTTDHGRQAWRDMKADFEAWKNQ